MKLMGNFKYLGIEKGTTREGKEFTRMGLLQGLKSEILFPNEEILKKVEGLKPMTEVTCSLSINVRDDKTAYVAIEDLFPVKQ
jgi:hypothetical protein